MKNPTFLRFVIWIPLLTAILLAGCNQPRQESPPPRMGQFPALKSAKNIDKIQNVTNTIFTSTRVDCSSDKRTVNQLWSVTQSTLDRSSNPRLLDWGIDPVNFKDGPGKIIALIYEIEPGDPGATNTIAEHYLVNEECFVFVWGWADNISLREE